MSEMRLVGQCHAFFQDALHPICQISLNTPVRSIHVNFARGWQVLSPLLRETSEGDASCNLGNHALHLPCANRFFILILSASKPTPKKKTQSWTYKGILFLWGSGVLSKAAALCVKLRSKVVEHFPSTPNVGATIKTHSPVFVRGSFLLGVLRCSLKLELFASSCCLRL